MRAAFIISYFFFVICILLFGNYPQRVLKQPVVRYAADEHPVLKKAATEKLEINSSTIHSYAKSNKFNTRTAFLIDMSLPSGNNRFFVYNMKKDSVEASGLVTHGSGKTSDGSVYSNVAGSNCTSLGKYKVGSSYYGRFGLAFKLHGLDATNSRAFERFVVLHAHSCVPDQEIAPVTICESQGCPTVSPAFLAKLQNYINKSSRPILLSIYE